MTDIESEVTPKKNEHPTMMRMYAIADITASVSDATGNENEMQASNGEYVPSQPETEDQVCDEDLYRDDPTPKKKQKKTKVPIREVINHIFKSLVSFTKAKIALPLPLCER